MTDHSNIYRSYIATVITLLLNGDFSRVRKEVEKMTVWKGVEGRDYAFIEYISLNALGLVELEEGDIDSAEKHLLDSSSISSPVIDSFGHNLLLAHKLMCLGRRDSIEEYLDRIGQKSNPFFPDYTPLKWLRDLQDGDHPEFGEHRFMHFVTSPDVLPLLREYAVCS